ncbi:MAG: hypothetical protein IJ298_09905 [Ruminococcus sp.]|nr:hypothetical protein [Ruminococcus sp.]
MKFRLTAIILCILLVLSTFAGCKGAQSDNNTADTYTIPSGAVTDITNIDSSVSTPDESGADVNNIEGFTPELFSNGEAAQVAILDTPVMVEAMGSYTGRFVEDGSDEAVENICAVVVKNIGGKPLQYATITLTAQDSTQYTFVLSTLPAGCSALVLETEKKVCGDTPLYECEASVDYTECEQLYTEDDRVKVTFDGELLHLENLTDTDFRAVYVRYKNYTAGNVYLGGITYNASFDNVAANSIYEYESAHFYPGGSQVLMVQIIE